MIHTWIFSLLRPSKHHRWQREIYNTKQQKDREVGWISVTGEVCGREIFTRRTRSVGRYHHQVKCLSSIPHPRYLLVSPSSVLPLLSPPLWWVFPSKCPYTKECLAIPVLQGAQPWKTVHKEHMRSTELDPHLQPHPETNTRSRENKYRQNPKRMR